MKKIYLLILLLILPGCSGYQPILSSNNLNFYITDIELLTKNYASKQIKRNLKPYTKNNDKEGVSLKISSTKNEQILSKDKKGDPEVYQMILKVTIEIDHRNENSKFSFQEKFSYNNQSNKFEFEQYKKNIEKNLTDIIYQSLLLRLRSI